MQILAVFLFSLLLTLTVSQVSGHAYFTFPVPRAQFCSDAATCVAGGSLGAQGPVWGFPNALTLSDSQLDNTCATSAGTVIGTAQADNPTPITKMTAGATYALNVFVSQVHNNNFINYANGGNLTDGWTIRGRDLGNTPNSIFGIQNGFSWASSQGVAFGGASLGPNWNNSATNPIGLWDARYFVTGQNLQVLINAPTVVTSDFVFQFYWGASKVAANGVAWISCADVVIQKNAAPSGLNIASGQSKVVVSSVFSFVVIFASMIMRKFTN